MGIISDSLERASARTATRPIPATAGAQMRFLVKQLKGSTRAVAGLLGISQRTVEGYVKDQIRRQLADRLAREVRCELSVSRQRCERQWGFVGKRWWAAASVHGVTALSMRDPGRYYCHRPIDVQVVY
jgi:hypothetical protein